MERPVREERPIRWERPSEGNIFSDTPSLKESEDAVAFSFIFICSIFLCFSTLEWSYYSHLQKQTVTQKIRL